MKRRLKSMKVRMAFVLCGILAVFLAIFFLEHDWAVRLAKQQAAEKSRGAMGMYLYGLEEALSELESCLASTMNTLDFQSYQKTQDPVERFILEQRVKRSLMEEVAVYRNTECLFVYHAGYDSWLYASKNHITQQENTRMREAVKHVVLEEEARPEGWFFLQWEERFYLARIQQQKELYAGTMIQVDTLLAQSQLQSMLGVDYLAFCRKDHSVVGNSFPCDVGTGQPREAGLYQEVKGKGERCMVFQAFSEKYGFYLVAALKEQAVIRGLGQIQRIGYLLFGFVAAVLVIFFAIMRHWIFLPLNKLTYSLQAFGQGDLEERMGYAGVSSEFSEVYGAFNRMAEQIADLKIGVYEEQIRRQKYQLQYYQLQINPHFYINCLNVIYNLSLTNKNEMIRQMTSYLGSNLRYAMEERALDFLYRELEYVENFLKIQNIRYHGCIWGEIRMENQELAMECIPPLAIQGFVENSIKYQVVPGETLYLSVNVKTACRNGKDGMEIEIIDSGSGFEEAVLAQLQRGERITDERGEHYGIYNILMRLQLIYQGQAEACFFNYSKSGGACVRLWIPLEHRAEKEEADAFTDRG